MSREIAPFGLRMPPELKEKLGSAAEKNHRSLNAELTSRLQYSIEQEEKGFSVTEPAQPYSADGVNIERLQECTQIVLELLEETGRDGTPEQIARWAAFAYSKINPDGTIDLKSFLKVITNTIKKETNKTVRSTA